MMNDGQALEIIINLRKEKKIKQEQVAEFFGLRPSARTTIGRWENGLDTPPPTKRTLFLKYIAEELGLKQYPDQLSEVWEALCHSWNWVLWNNEEKQKYNIVDAPPQVETDWDALSNEELLARLKSANPGTSSTTIKKISKRVSQGDLPVEVLLEASTHPYFVIRKLAVERILKYNGPNTINHLYAFRNSSYHITQNLIRDYISKRNDANDLAEEEFNMALEILICLSKAPKVSDLSKKKDLRLLDKMRG